MIRERYTLYVVGFIKILPWGSFENVDPDERVKIKCLLHKYSVIMWTAFVWLWLVSVAP